MSTVQRLGIRYLWVDCYCIIQSGEGSKEDWETESARTKTIYAEGLLNIGATRATNPQEGCFVERDITPLLQPCTFRWRPTKPHEESTYQIQFEDEMYGAIEGLPCHPIMVRGLIMQERILCQRMLHFGRDKLYWG